VGTHPRSVARHRFHWKTQALEGTIPLFPQARAVTPNNDCPPLLIPEPTAATASPVAGRVVALAAMLVIYGLAYFQRTGVPGTIFDELQHDFGLSASAVTALGSVFVYVYAGMQLAVGIAADRYGGRRTLLFGGTIMCAGAVMFPCSHGTTMLFASRVLIGFGSSFVYLSIVKEVDTLFAVRHFAGLLGLAMLVSYAGNIGATLPFERAVHAFGWRDTLTAVAGISIAALAVTWLVLRRLNHVPTGRTGIPLRPLWDVMRNRRSWALLVWSMVNFPIVFVIQGILGKKFLQDTVGLSSAGAAAFVLVMAAACGVAAACGGPILRLSGQRRKPVIVCATGMVLAATVLLLVAVLAAAPGWVFLAGYVLLALSTVGTPAGSATMKEVNRPDAVAVSISVLNTAAYAGVGILGNLAGAILDASGSRAAISEARIAYPSAAYAALFACLAGLAGVSMLVTIFKVPETRGRAVTLEEIERALA
jgi:predicted MFS family arabinose efflux permease